MARESESILFIFRIAFSVSKNHYQRSTHNHQRTGECFPCESLSKEQGGKYDCNDETTLVYGDNLRDVTHLNGIKVAKS